MIDLVSIRDFISEVANAGLDALAEFIMPDFDITLDGDDDYA